jgi:hypothetical protein
MTCVAEPLEEVAPVVESPATPDKNSEMLPFAEQTLEVMAEAGVFVPMGIAWDMSGPGIVSL